MKTRAQARTASVGLADTVIFSPKKPSLKKSSGRDLKAKTNLVANKDRSNRVLPKGVARKKSKSTVTRRDKVQVTMDLETVAKTTVPTKIAEQWRDHLVAADKRFDALIQQDPAPPIIQAIDFQVTPQHIFHYLLRSVTYQQLAGKAAAAIYGRFCGLFLDQTTDVETLVLMMAEKVAPVQVLQLSMEQLRAAGLSQRKSESFIAIAEEFQSGTFAKKQFMSMSNEEISTELTRLKGVGQWSVDMLLLFYLHRPDILPLGDLAIKKGVQIFFQLKELPKPQEVERLAMPWKPFRSMASWYMWKLAGLTSLPT